MYWGYRIMGSIQWELQFINNMKQGGCSTCSSIVNGEIEVTDNLQRFGRDFAQTAVL